MNTFTIETPIEQFMGWMESYQKRNKELPSACWVSKKDLKALMDSLGYHQYITRTNFIPHLCGVALHIQEDK